ncbi:MAG TPA: S8 family serine peptidase [Mycobacteriales bacterium]|nr:S8 family serine peptidase [Mycobacteriales bacterium]
MSRRTGGLGLAAAALLAAGMARALPAAAGAPTTPAGSRCAGPVTAADPTVPWAQRRLGSDRAWVLTRGGPTVVAVVDTGVSAKAPALAGVVAPGADVLAGGRADTDCSGHGTFVTGLLAARPSPGRGLAGVAPGVRVLPIRVTNNPGEVDPGKLAAGIRAAVDGSARVIAVPVSTATAPPALRAAVARAVRRDVLVVATAEPAAGLRSGPATAPPVAYPAALPGVLAVAPIGPDGRAGTDTPLGAQPALAAPGSDLTSISTAGTGTITANGRGLAVAFVAGAAALVRSYRPGLTAAQVQRRLEATADHPSNRLPHPALGYGVVDPTAAVTTALPEESGDPVPQPDRAPIRVPVQAAPDRAPARIALVAAGMLAATAGLGAVLAATLARGRRRRWRPATRRS